MALDFNEHYDIEEQVHEIKELVPFERIFKKFDEKMITNGRSFIFDHSVFSKETQDFLDFHFYDEHHLNKIDVIHNKYSKSSSTVTTIEFKKKYHRSEIEEIEKIFKEKYSTMLSVGGSKINTHYPFLCHILPPVKAPKKTEKENVYSIIIFFDYWKPNDNLFDTLEDSKELIMMNKIDYNDLPW